MRSPLQELMMSLEGMREMLRGSLGKSLQALQEEDRVAAAWPVVCGRAMADKGRVVCLENGLVRIEVEDDAWLRQLIGMQRQLVGELARISGVSVIEIHFEKKRNER